MLMNNRDVFLDAQVLHKSKRIFCKFLYKQVKRVAIRCCNANKFFSLLDKFLYLFSHYLANVQFNTFKRIIGLLLHFLNLNLKEIALRIKVSK